jgi:hypothetical protein
VRVGLCDKASVRARAWERMRVFRRASVYACARACVYVSVRARVCVCACVRARVCRKGCLAAVEGAEAVVEGDDVVGAHGDPLAQQDVDVGQRN